MDKNKTILTKPVKEDEELFELLIEEAKQHYFYPKFKEFEKFFYDESNKKTYGNATLSYCAAFGLDPADKKAYNVAGVLGHKLLKKVKNFQRKWLEKQGLTAGKILDLYQERAIKDVNILYSLAELYEIDLPVYKSIINAREGLFQQNNTQINIEGGVNFAQLTDQQLIQYIESKRFALRSTVLARSGEAIQTESNGVHPQPQEAIRSDGQ